MFEDDLSVFLNRFEFLNDIVDGFVVDFVDDFVLKYLEDE